MTPKTSLESGTLNWIRAAELGTAIGEPGDFLTAELIVNLDTIPDMFLGLQLRDDEQLPARQAMLNILTQALIHELQVTIAFAAEPKAKTGTILWVSIGRP